MATFLYSWTPTFNTLPTDNEQALNGAARIRDFKAALYERLLIDHSWGGDGNDGAHKSITLLARSAPAAPAAGQLIMYLATGGTFPRVMNSSGVSASLEAWPVGSIFISVSSTNPNSLLGYGTWVAFATGRTLVSIDTAQAEFNVVRETGGAKTHTLTTTEMPSHSHGVSDPGHAHTVNSIVPGGQYSGSNQGTQGIVSTSTNTTGISITANGGNGAHNNLQPYMVVYMWERTA